MNKRSWMIVGGTVSAIALAPLAAVAGPSLFNEPGAGSGIVVAAGTTGRNDRLLKPVVGLGHPGDFALDDAEGGLVRIRPGGFDGHLEHVTRSADRPARLVSPASAEAYSCNGKAATVVGLGRHDDIDGRSGNDITCGGSGNDEIDGGSGHDEIDGEADADRIRGGSGRDELSGGSGADKISGLPG